jgi:hypothetical protein
MSKESKIMDDTQLDATLGRLRPPAPSDTLVARISAMAPRPQRTLVTPRRAVAAMLAVALGAATMLQTTDNRQTAVFPEPVAAIADPAGEIPVSDLALSEEANPNALPTEPFSVAGMPLE